MNKENKESVPEKDRLESHQRCPSCGKWMIQWGKNQEDKVTFPNKSKVFIWRCNCGHKEEHPWIPLSEKDAFKKAWEKAQRIGKGK